MGWFDTYFVQPIQLELGYNLVNTATYAVVALAILYVLFRAFMHLKIKINMAFFVSMIPFILFGSSTRAFVDSSYLVRNFWTVAPGIYLITCGLFLAVMLSGFLISKRTSHFSWQIHTFIIGLMVLFIQWFRFSARLSGANLSVFFGILIAVCVLLPAFYFAFAKLGWSWIADRFGFLAFSAHLLDSTATAVILYIVGGWEKHPLPRFFIERFGSFSFIPLKLLVVIPAVYLISTELKDRQLRNFLLISIAVLGFGEATRNLVSMIL